MSRPSRGNGERWWRESRGSGGGRSGEGCGTHWAVRAITDGERDKGEKVLFPPPAPGDGLAQSA